MIRDEIKNKTNLKSIESNKNRNQKNEDQTQNK
jgi:hypothetical protein